MPAAAVLGEAGQVAAGHEGAYRAGDLGGGGGRCGLRPPRGSPVDQVELRGRQHRAVLVGKPGVPPGRAGHRPGTAARLAARRCGQRAAAGEQKDQRGCGDPGHQVSLRPHHRGPLLPAASGRPRRMRKTRRRCHLAAVLLTAPATTGGPSHPGETRTRAAGPGEASPRPPGPSQGGTDRWSRRVTPGPRPDARAVLRPTRSARPRRGGGGMQMPRFAAWAGISCLGCAGLLFLSWTSGLPGAAWLSWQCSGGRRCSCARRSAPAPGGRPGA